MATSSARDLSRILLGVLFLGGLILTSFWILRPFLGATIWAVMIVVATWPMMLWFEQRLWGRRGLAVSVMTLILLLSFVVPLTLGIGTIVLNADAIGEQFESITTWKLPPPPAWVAALPVVGEKIVAMWQQAAAAGFEGLLAWLAPYAGSVTRWFVGEAGSVGLLVVQFLLTLILAALMYAHGEAAASVALRFGRRLGGERGRDAMALAGRAIRGVALGLVVTAAAQSILGGIALAIADVPFAGLLTVLMFMLCLAQLGPTLVMAPATFWAYWSGEPAWGTFLLVAAIVVGTMDNVLRPMLIRKGADLPLLLIFAGVIGGLLAFGLIGLFVGPVVLAVAYTLFDAWLGDVQATPTD